MIIALCADSDYPINAFIEAYLTEQGHYLKKFGAFSSHKDECWAEVGLEAANAIYDGICDEGIFICWSGTGISMAANKVTDVRAALCTDARTAEAARVWNHANVLALSQRLLTQDLATEILDAWFETPMDERAEPAVIRLVQAENAYRHKSA